MALSRAAFFEPANIKPKSEFQKGDRNDDKELARQEIWKKLFNYPGYEVSSYGRVRSKNKVLSLQTNVSSGYLQVNLKHRDGDYRTCHVHHLVAMGFIGNRPIGLYVLHRDDCKHNNAAANLYYGTAYQNYQDRVRNGRAVWTEKPVIRDDGEIYRSVSEAAKCNGVTPSQISRCCSGKILTTGRRSFQFR